MFVVCGYLQNILKNKKIKNKNRIIKRSEEKDK